MTNKISSTTCQETDVIILGAGLVGLTMALLCSQQQLRVLVIEANEPKFNDQNDTYDIRVSAITRASQKIFEEIGIWDQIVKARVSPYQKMKVFDHLGHGEIEFDAALVAEPDLGAIIENRVMLKALWDKVKAKAKPEAKAKTEAKIETETKAHEFINIITPAKPILLYQDEHNIQLVLQNQKNENQNIENQKIKAKLLIGADGAHSWVRESLKMPTKIGDYQQTAIIANVVTEASHQETAWQSFLEEGPLAFLPLSDPNTCSIVWTVSHGSAKDYMATNDEDFCLKLAHAFDYRLGKILSISERKSFPLKRLYCEHPIEKRVALIGDAYHVIHPLAGLGVNLGLKDAHCLSEILKSEILKVEKDNDNHQRGNDNHQNVGSFSLHDVGRFSLLQQYERKRRGQTLLTLGMMEFFKQLFNRTESTVAILRSSGLNAINRSSLIKKKIIREALLC